MSELPLAPRRDGAGGCKYIEGRKASALASRAARLSSIALLSLSGACKFEHDTVEPGYYGSSQAGSSGARASVAGAQGVQGAPSPSPSATGKPPVSASNDAAPAGAGAMAASSSVAGAGAGAAGSNTSGHASAGTTSSAATGGGAGSPASTTAQAGASGAAGNGAPSAIEAGAAGMEPVSACDMTGRWLGTLHYVTDALGQLQYTHTYLYYEIAQQADAFMITKGLHCGDDALGGGALSATVDFKRSWAGCMSRVSYEGRTGMSVQTAAGCLIDFAKWYVVRGATVPHYLDPSHPLPTADDAAMGSQPGWEDWDGDGKPGISGYISGAATGKIFVAPRTWTSLTGAAPSLDSVITLAMQWDQQQNVMAYEGSPLLGTQAVRAANAKLHFARFVRLNLGASYQLGERLRLSASVHTPYCVELGTSFTFLLGNGIEQSSGVRFVLDYTPWQLGAGASFDLLKFETTTLSIAASALYARWSDYLDRHGAKPTPSYAWADTLAPTLGLRFQLQGLTTWLDASYVPTPVPEQTGRTNYVDNDRMTGALGAEYRFPLWGTELKLGGSFQLHGPLPRYQRKLPTPTLPDGTVVAPKRVKDELPDDAQLSGEPVAAAQGLQTNNPGWPGFSSGGLC